MDDKTRGVSGERTTGRSDEYLSGRDTTASRTTDEESRVDEPTTATGVDTTRGYATDVGRGSTASTRRDAPRDQRTRQIREEIEQTREDMSETVNAIQDRLRPGNIAANAAESVRSAASDAAHDITESRVVRDLRANPVPTAMVGIGIAGLAWLAFGRRESRSQDRFRQRYGARDWRTVPSYREEDEYYRSSGAYRSYETAGEYNPAISESGREYVESRERFGGIGETTRDVRRASRRAQAQLQRTWSENPLLIGAASAVLGAIVGMAVPETERENELMGETRDNMVEGVQQMARDTAKRVQDAAANAVGLSSDTEQK